jgi:hypothetical protein
MKQVPLICCRFLFALLLLGISGCATSSVNPQKAHANTGYVDFRADPSASLSWQVARLDDQTKNFTIIYSELSSPPDGILRLAFAPGRYQFQITFLNRVVTEPGLVEVTVVDGKITPVQVTLVPNGTASVQQKEQRVGMKVGGFAGRKTKYSSDESDTYQVSATAAAPLPYQPK